MDLRYQIKRSPKRKKLTISIERDSNVIVHAPQNTAIEKIEAVVQSKRQWIFEKIHHPQKYQDRPHPPGKELVSGESALYLGRNYQIELVNNGTEITFDRKFLVPRRSNSRRKEVLRDWYLQKAKQKVLPRVTSHAKALGVEFKSAKMVDNRYRWGSCTVNNNINLNWRLIKAPTFVIDYVIVHELAHLIESNHTQRFWNIVRTQIAKTDKAKEWLRVNGALLEDDI